MNHILHKRPRTLARLYCSHRPLLERLEDRLLPGDVLSLSGATLSGLDMASANCVMVKAPAADMASKSRPASMPMPRVEKKPGVTALSLISPVTMRRWLGSNWKSRSAKRSRDAPAEDKKIL